MSNDNQPSLPLIPHAYGGEVISLRARDGYINASAMCKAAGSKTWSDYNRLSTTKAFIEELASVLQIHRTELVQSIAGGQPELQGTWVHPRIAIHLAQWLSPKFAVQVTDWVYDWMQGTDPRDRIWRQFEDRISLNFDSVPIGYFSVFKESGDIFAALILGGCNLGTRVLLDISVGSHWGRYWKAQNLADKYGERGDYDHNYPDYFPQSWSNPQSAKCYPEEAILEFRRWVRDVYSQRHLPAYLQDQVKQKKLPAAMATNAIQHLEDRERRRSPLRIK